MELSKSGKTIRYTDVGEGETLILLPGTLGDETLFVNQQDALKDSFRIVVFDHPRVSKLDMLVDLYHEVFNELVDSRFILGGSSVGGWIAQHYTKKYPEDVKSLILGNTFCDNSSLRAQSLKLYSSSGWVPWFMFRRKFWSKLRKDLEDYPELLPYFDANIKKMGKSGLRQRLWWSLSPVEVPVTVDIDNILLISSDDDPTVPAPLTRQLRDTYPKADVHRFKSGGHFPYLTRPDEYSDVLRTFLKGQ